MLLQRFDGLGEQIPRTLIPHKHREATRWAYGDAGRCKETQGEIEKARESEVRQGWNLRKKTRDIRKDEKQREHGRKKSTCMLLSHGKKGISRLHFERGYTGGFDISYGDFNFFFFLSLVCHLFDVVSACNRDTRW